MTRVAIPWILGTALGLAVRFGWSGASADHPEAEYPSYAAPHSHIRSLNTSGEREDYCVAVEHRPFPYPPIYLHSAALEDVTDILFANESGEGPIEWNDVPTVSLWGSVQECPDQFPAVYEFHFNVVGVLDECSGGASACIDRMDLSLEEDPASGHQEYQWARVWIMPHTISGSANHEVGHGFGLCDGGPGAPTNRPQCVAWPQHDECMDSVMHSYDGFWPWQSCSEPDWPSALDVSSVIGLVPVGGSQQGGSASGCGSKAFCG